MVTGAATPPSSSTAPSSCDRFAAGVRGGAIGPVARTTFNPTGNAEFVARFAKLGLFGGSPWRQPSLMFMYRPLRIRSAVGSAITPIQYDCHCSSVAVLSA